MTILRTYAGFSVWSSRSVARDRRHAREALDAWVREIVAWHFNPATGCPFWLEYAKKLEFDPLKEIKGFDDLQEVRPVRGRMAARRPGAALGAARRSPDKPVYVFETGGTTGIPKSRIAIDDFRIDYEMFSDDAAGRVLSRRAPTG